MCGIAGIYQTDQSPADVDLLETMLSTIEHRGPDGKGVFSDAEVALGHRRLSIIDLSGGAQPMGTADGRLHVIFNGEIYNYLELQEQLESSGHRFRTTSDTEVILHAYDEWGADCVTRFNGMFAFALWDSEKRILFLARDHLGIKPLYYTHIGSTILFASEIKALLAHPQCEREVDTNALAQLFSLHYVPSPRTLFSGIYKLPPAHAAIIANEQFAINRFWNRRPDPTRNDSESDLIEEYRALLQDAVRIQMRSDVPVGLFLSSGVDSGMLLALMSEYADSPVHTFTIGFEDGIRTNETDDARELARQYSTSHSELVIGPGDYRNYYDRYLWDIEEPVGNESAAAFYFVPGGRRVAAD